MMLDFSSSLSLELIAKVFKIYAYSINFLVNRSLTAEELNKLGWRGG